MIVEKSLDSLIITSVNYQLLIEELKQISLSIKSRHSEVEDILLFGSFARGDYTPDSDIDLLLIITHSDQPFLERPCRFLSYFEGIPFDVNLLIYTRDELINMQKNKNPFIREVLETDSHASLLDKD